jgi:glycosyltransferase involved in cell wall biosynthesis
MSCYNHAPYVVEVVESVLAQDFPYIKLLVIAERVETEEQ